MFEEALHQARARFAWSPPGVIRRWCEDFEEALDDHLLDDQPFLELTGWEVEEDADLPLVGHLEVLSGHPRQFRIPLSHAFMECAFLAFACHEIEVRDDALEFRWLCVDDELRWLGGRLLVSGERYRDMRQAPWRYT